MSKPVAFSGFRGPTRLHCTEQKQYFFNPTFQQIYKAGVAKHKGKNQRSSSGVTRVGELRRVNVQKYMAFWIDTIKTQGPDLRFFIFFALQNGENLRLRFWWKR